MANKRRRRQKRRNRPKADQEDRVLTQRDKVIHARELKDQVAATNERLVEAGVSYPRELYATMAAVEALSDLLVENGVIERVDLNCGRLHHVLKYLQKLEANNQAVEVKT